MSAQWKSLTVLFAAWVAAGCAGHKEETRPTQETEAGMEQSQQMPMRGQMCPAEVPGTTVKAEDISNGEALVFTNDDPAQVKELQRRVEHIAVMHGHHATGMHGGVPAGCPACGAYAGGQARAEKLPNGVRMLITTEDPAELDALRAKVREHAAQMQQGQCPWQQEPQHQH